MKNLLLGGLLTVFVSLTFGVACAGKGKTQWECLICEGTCDGSNEIAVWRPVNSGLEYEADTDEEIEQLCVDNGRATGSQTCTCTVISE